MVFAYLDPPSTIQCFSVKLGVTCLGIGRKRKLNGAFRCYALLGFFKSYKTTRPVYYRVT